MNTNTASEPTTSALVRRVATIVVAAVAMLIGFAIASSASPAHADTVAGDTVFGADVLCGGDELFFTVNSDSYDGSYAKIWVWDPTTEEWVTDDNWVEAGVYASYNIADLTFEPGYYTVYLSYAQWNGYDWDFSGEYVNTFQQYHAGGDHEASDNCYMGN